MIFQFQGSTLERAAPSPPPTQTPTETSETTETTETTTSSTLETSTEKTEVTTDIAETTVISTEVPADTTEAEVSPVSPQNNFVSLVGPLSPVKPAPVLRPSTESTFDPVNFQPVSEQERDKRRPVRIPAPARPEQNILMRIISAVRQKLQYLNIF